MTKAPMEQLENTAIENGSRPPSSRTHHCEPTSPSDNLQHKPLVVGITGGSGAGKTVLAERLSQRLGSSTALLAHDDYYKHMPHMTSQEADTYDFDSLDALDTHLLVEHLRALLDGKPAEAPIYDFATHSRASETRHVEPAPIILIDGLLIMCDPALRAMLDLVIFVDSDPDVRALRRIERDCRERGTDVERAVKMFLNTSKPAHDKYVEPFKREADIIISDAFNDVALDIVTSGIAELAKRS